MHDWRADVRARLAGARLHPQDEAELVEEIAQHLEAEYAELAPRIGAAAARERLLAELNERAFDDAAAGWRRRARPSSARVWSAGSLVRDIRYGARSLRRSPGIVAAGVTALALGIGLTTVMYSVIYGTLIRGLPYPHGSRIAMVYHADQERRGDPTMTRYGDFARYRTEQRSFEAFGAYAFGTANVSGGDRPDRIAMARMTARTFEVTGVRPALGRTFTSADEQPGAPLTAILGWSLWRERLGGDSAVIGRQLRVDGRIHIIVGVMPEGYEFPIQTTQLWLPLEVEPAAAGLADGRGVVVVGRLGAGTTYERATSELSTVAHRLEAERPDSAAGDVVVVRPFVDAWVPSRVHVVLNAMLAAVLLVLLVACANVANLLVDRAAQRAREIGIRTALGASRLAVVRQSMVESALLALLAAIVGTALAQAGIAAFNHAVPPAERLFWTDIRLHPPVLLFVLVLATLASIVSGILPALQSARLDVSTILKDESHGVSSLRAGRMSRAIVVAELATSSALLLAAGFLTTSIIRLNSVDPGFATRDVLTGRITLSGGGGDTAAQRRFFEAFDRAAALTPGLDSMYLGSGLPGTEWRGTSFRIEGHSYASERELPGAQMLAVNAGFFSTFGVRVLRGRTILPSDHAGAQPVAVVSESFVRRYFPDEDPLGQRIVLGSSPDRRRALLIVGVVPTMLAVQLRSSWPPEVLTSFWQQRRLSTASVALRANAVADAAALRAVIAAIDPEVPLYATASMGDVLARPMWPVRVFGTMFVIFGIVALLLAAIGLYASIAFSVSRRVREMGIRMALGAARGDVVRLVCWQGAKQILLGVGIGLIAGAALVSLMRVVLFGVEPGDPGVIALVLGVLGAAGFVACIVPALRATRVDPLVALRAE